MTTYHINKLTEEKYLHFEGFGITNEDGNTLFENKKKYDEFMEEEFEQWVEFSVEDSNLKKFLLQLKMCKKYERFLKREEPDFTEESYLEALTDIDADNYDRIESREPYIMLGKKIYEYKEYENWWVLIRS